VTTASAPKGSTPPGGPVLLYLLSLVLVIVFRVGWSGVLVWGLVCYLGAERLFPGMRLRHLCGSLLSLFGAVVIIFFTALSLRPLAMLLFLPGIVLVGVLPLLTTRIQEIVGRSPVTVLILYLLATLGFYGFGATLGPLPGINDDFLFALVQEEPPEALSEEERAAAIDIINDVLGGAQVDPSTLPPRLAKRHYGRVWVTFYRRSSESRWVRGESPSNATNQDLYGQLALAAKKAGDQAMQEGWDPEDELIIQVDIAGAETDIQWIALRRGLRSIVGSFNNGHANWDSLVYRTEPGVVGFRMQGDKKSGVVLPGDVITNGMLTPRSRSLRYRTDTFQVVWDELSRRAGIPRSDAGSRSFSTFRTYCFVQPVPSEPRTVEVYRGNVLGPAKVDEKILLDAIDRAGRWLLQQVEKDGRFDYQYYPTTDSHGKGYNEVRHAGSVYGLFHMAHLTASEPTLRDQSDDYLRAGILAMDRVYRNLGTNPGTRPEDGYVTFLQGKRGRKSNSGSPSLALLGFMMRPAPEDVADEILRAGIWREGDDRIMEGLARTLLRMIDDQGQVYRYWRDALKETEICRDSCSQEHRHLREPLYFPGEAMLALAMYYQRTGDDVWLEGARRIGRQQIRRARNRLKVPDHWVMQALDLLDRADPGNDEWRKGAYAMGRRYVREQFPPQKPPFPDYQGAYRRIQEVPRTTRAASRGEAIGGVVRIAWRHGDNSWDWERSLLEGSRHLIEQIFTEDNSFFVPRPEEVLGAVRMGIVDNHCRIDNNQHAVVALSNALTALRHRRPGWGQRGEHK